MQKSTDILNELKELSPVLFELRSVNKNPFTVPENYFSDLSNNVNDHVASGLADGIGKHAFKVPENYFESLPNNIFTSIESGLSEEIGKKSFAVPENYFDNLADNILDKIEAEEQPVEVKPRGRVIDLQGRRKREKMNTRRLFAMVASLAALIILTLRWGPGLTIDTFSSNDALEYLEENYTEFESDDLFALVAFTDEDISMDMSQELEDELEQYLEENIDDLDEYLLTNEI